MDPRGHPFHASGVNAAPAPESLPTLSTLPDEPTASTATEAVEVGAQTLPTPAAPSEPAAASTPPESTAAGGTTPENPAAAHAPAMAFAPLTALALGTGRATLAAHAASGSEEAPPTPVTDASRTPASAWSWVPIRSLGARHRERILKHLLTLEERARYLRFGFPATDAQLAQYVDRIDFDRDEVFGIFNRRLQLIALAHLAHPSAPGTNGRPAMSEFGVSVLSRARRRGFGRRLFEHATLHARNRGVRAMFIHALSENTAMLKIAREAGATVHREGSETDAWLELPPDTFASHLDELVGTHAAELDYQLKTRVQQVNQLFGRDGGDAGNEADGSDGRDAEAPSGVE
jgi:ribosomal protein S18 acetylase RimI-like enzyme